MSFNRIDRNRKINRKENLKSISEKIISIFSKNGLSTTDRLIIGGPANSKSELEEYLLSNYSIFNNKILKTITTEKLDKQEAENIYLDNLEMFQTKENIEEFEIFKEINDLIIRNPDKLCFGKEVEECIHNFTIEKCVVSNINKLNINEINCTIIESNAIIKKFGGNVGIKWY